MRSSKLPVSLSAWSKGIIMKLFKLTLLSFALTSALAAQTITVAAAANMKYAVTDIAKAFTKESGIDVKIITGASGKLTQQIMSGAPYDAFLSADVEFPAKLAQSGFTTTPSQVYAYGSLILWSDTGVDLSKGVAVVAGRGRPGDRLLLLAVTEEGTGHRHVRVRHQHDRQHPGRVGPAPGGD